ncbi:MAG: glutamate synthase large subunit [Candidatus Omnitrophica bacterium]|nr:glutamate synthase large subunit [Candidatus Omnitrophota bacterium]
MRLRCFPEKQGLYDPAFEKDACGVGFVCNIKGVKSNRLVKDAVNVLRRLSHRGAVGADPQTGDGAGILLQTPHAFFQEAAAQAKISLPESGGYGTGIVFLPTDGRERSWCKNIFAGFIQAEGQELIGWREVPVDNTAIGAAARQTQPVIEQVFIRKNPQIKDALAFERRLYLIRKQVENTVRSSALQQKSFFYITNLSSRTFIYKGLLMPDQVDKFYLDLQSERLVSAIGLVHSRYSTNTFPTWDLAQPFRFLAHNGEINTLRGNVNWMQAREGLLKSAMFGADIEKAKPVLVPGGSDSAAIDNAFELLSLAGRSLPHVMMMLIPSAWESNALMDEQQRDFYRYHACCMEPWDGPAAIAVTDGIRVSAVLDRNGLRPARYIVTKHDTVVMASEMGVIDVAASDIVVSSRLEPGKMFYIDTEEGRIVQEDEIKSVMANARPYGQWLKQHLVSIDDLPAAAPAVEKQPLPALLKAFGYTREDLKVILKPMAEQAQEPTGSMGNDTPLAVLSSQPQVFYNYFKQLFAQVTNPAIDSIREEVVMTLHSYIGPERGILEEAPEHAKKIEVPHPVLTNEELAKLRAIDRPGFKTKTISLLFKARDPKNFLATLDRVCNVALSAINEGFTFIILSDRGVDKEHAALPALVAVGAVHHFLVTRALRTQISILVESAEPREVHHYALLFGYGADCINPYLAYAALQSLVEDNTVPGDAARAQNNYIKAIDKGLLKILSKMGISTLRSYRGAQIFEALGVHEEVIERCFAGTPSRIGGVGFEAIRQETVARHAEGFPEKICGPLIGAAGGIYQWKPQGEFHLWNPDSIAAVQDASRTGDYQRYKEFAALINDQRKNPATLRSLFDFKPGESIALSQVEPVEKIVQRFATGAMSFGSISKEAHESLAIAMNRLGGRSNTGEGGEDPARFIRLPNGDSKRSAIKQVASGRFGVTTNYLVNADELQIKIAQGAKPGEGGQLPGHKVSAIIARTRYTTPGVTLISPPPHHDIYSIEDLAQLIFDLKNVNPRARISVKLVSEVGVGTVAAGVAKGHADLILISGGDGGTGASPLSSIRHAGLPWELGLSETHQTLVLNDLRSRVRLQTDGQMRTGRDVAIAALLGAEEYGFCTVGLIILGCVMLRHCHLNNCSVGVATQEEILRKRFRGRPEYLVNYFRFVAEELREIMAGLGMRTLDEMIGRADVLQVDESRLPGKAKQLDYRNIIYRPPVAATVGVRCTQAQDHGIERVLDRKLISLAKPALEKGVAVREQLPIHNTDRTTGAMLSGETVLHHGEDGLMEDTICFKFSGVAGQSFAAWLAKGITFELEGMANDYVGKGMSGGKVIIYPDRRVSYAPAENILIGNTAFYGAISGEAYIRGVAGERFCIRNSGLYAVVEGVGDHGCEYMTGGRVVILGKTGRNFGAGMSGGIAYVYDADGLFRRRCNMGMIELEELSAVDADEIQELLHNHWDYTQSDRARSILDRFSEERRKFVKVMPLEYKRILRQRDLEEKMGLGQPA